MPAMLPYGAWLPHQMQCAMPVIEDVCMTRLPETLKLDVIRLCTSCARFAVPVHSESRV